MRENVKQRLSQTEDGQAIIDLIESFGGWRRFTEASGLPDHYLQNWYKRGKISQDTALLLEQLPAFQEAGWDKFRMVPSVSVAEWNREKRTGASEWFKAWQKKKAQAAAGKVKK